MLKPINFSRNFFNSLVALAHLFLSLEKRRHSIFPTGNLPHVENSLTIHDFPKAGERILHIACCPNTPGWISPEDLFECV